MIILEVGTKDYATDVVLVKKAMSQMESLLMTYNGYALGEPSSRFGWTFFQMAVKPELQQGIESRFADMIRRYGWGKPDTKFAKFLGDYLKARGCGVEVRPA